MKTHATGLACMFLFSFVTHKANSTEINVATEYLSNFRSFFFPPAENRKRPFQEILSSKFTTHLNCILNECNLDFQAESFLRFPN